MRAMPGARHPSSGTTAGVRRPALQRFGTREAALSPRDEHATRHWRRAVACATLQGPLVLQVVRRGSIMRAMLGARHPSSGATAAARRAALQHFGMREAALSPCDGAYDMALEMGQWHVRCGKGFKWPKMDLLLKLGKGTSSPKSNSSRKKEIIN
ncbi:hypothetical protein HAX54_049708 [Datura stramonium]|uniref:Uncharacterized protein n=1 Tax=Datura stramonium TaxID=4076 RepID=A0ABS8SVZ7_DATST|nr:hypothetical protein [Datura stramonium]